MTYDWLNDNKTTEICRSIGGYPYIPAYNPAENLRQVRKEYSINSMIDLGCGRGNILDCALQEGIKIADGVEYFKSHIAAARRLLKKYEKSRYTIYQGDLRFWKPKKKYDLIYMFDPISQEDSRKIFFDNMFEFLPEDQLIAYFSIDFSKTHPLMANHFEHAGKNPELPMFKFHRIPKRNRNNFWKI